MQANLVQRVEWKVVSMAFKQKVLTDMEIVLKIFGVWQASLEALDIPFKSGNHLWYLVALDSGCFFLTKIDVVQNHMLLNNSIFCSSIFVYFSWFNSSVKDLFTRPVMKRWEVRLYFAYSIISTCMYFLLPTIFGSTPKVAAKVTTLYYIMELLLASVLLSLTNLRIYRLRKVYKSDEDTQRVLAYISSMNTLLIVIELAKAMRKFCHHMCFFKNKNFILSTLLILLLQTNILKQ